MRRHARATADRQEGASPLRACERPGRPCRRTLAFLSVLLGLLPPTPARTEPPSTTGDDEPVGWPLAAPERPKPDRRPLSPAVRAAPPTPHGRAADAGTEPAAATEADTTQPPETTDGAERTGGAAPPAADEAPPGRTVAHDPLLAPLPSVVADAAPLVLRFATDEYAPTRDQVRLISRLATIHRIGQGRIDVLSWAAADSDDGGDGGGEGGEASEGRRAALERALARALAIRDLLRDEGIPLARIDATALIGPPPQEADIVRPPREGVRIRIVPDLVAGVP